MKRFLLASSIIVSVAACTDAPATQYAGTVMSESAPESEGSLRLTLFSRDDSSFSGVIELGAPARGTGSAYAWHEDSELRVVSVGAESGDTIIWSSPLTDEGLGGRFEVVGGEHTGDQGTWRARLVKGEPATRETLLLPHPVRLPPVTALWPLLLLAATGVWLARWIRRAPAAVSSGVTSGVPHWHETAIGGWLLLFAIGQGIGILVGLRGLGATLNDVQDSLGIGTVLLGLQPLVVLEAAMHALAIPAAIGGLLMLVRQSPYAPRYWFAYLAASSVYLIVDLFALAFIEPQMVRLLGDEVAQAGTDGTRFALLTQVIASVIWATYWVRSRRVRATFGAAALDQSITAPVPAAGAVDLGSPARGGRQRTRVVLSVVGGTVGVFVALYAIGEWSTRVSPYSVPEDADIRETVTGRWTWTSDSAGCENAHTIAFAEDGAVMTITSNDIGMANPVTTYDVEFVSRSTIRGVIRNETRVTDAGAPVVWDLVLTSPDEYRWQRTDVPGRYTASIRRCPDLADGPPEVD